MSQARRGGGLSAGLLGLSVLVAMSMPPAAAATALASTTRAERAGRLAVSGHAISALLATPSVTISVASTTVYGEEHLRVTAQLGMSSPAGTVEFFVNGASQDSLIPITAGGSEWVQLLTPFGSSQVFANYRPSSGGSYDSATLTVERKPYLYVEPIVVAPASGVLGLPIPKSIQYSTPFTSSEAHFQTLGPPTSVSAPYPRDWTVDAYFSESRERYGEAVSCPVTIRVDQQHAELQLTVDKASVAIKESITITVRALLDGQPTTLPIGTNIELLYGDAWRPSANGTMAIDSGVATTQRSFELSGDVRLSARFQQSDDFASPVSDGVIVHVTPGPAPTLGTSPPGSTPTTLTLSSSLNPNVRGDDPSMVATVEPHDATGAVWFYEGGELLDTVQVNNATGEAHLNYWRAEGVHDITALFYADNLLWAASRATLTQTTLPRASTTTVSASNAQSLGREPVTFTATVDPKPVESGTVVDFPGLGSKDVDPATGQASIVVASLLPGPHDVEADYEGSRTVSPSTGSVSHAVVRRATTIAFIPRSPQLGGGITTDVTFTPDPSAPYQGDRFAPVLVELFVDGRLVDWTSGDFSNGLALGGDFNPGTYEVRARFPGDPYLEPSDTPLSEYQQGGRDQPPVPLSGTASVAPNDVAASNGVVDVTVTVDQSSGPVSDVQLSNDGAHWATFAYYGHDLVIPWSVTETTCGGSSIDGAHTIFVRWARTSLSNPDLGLTQALGTTLRSDPVSVTSVIDRTPPSVSVPSVSLPSPGAFPLVDGRLRVHWSAFDALSGVARFIVSDDNGTSVHRLTLPTPTATSLTVLTSPGSTHTYRVIAIDRAGNRSAAVASAPVRIHEVSDGAVAIVYAGSWRSVSDAAARGGTLHTTIAVGASAFLSFSGRSVGWIASTGPGYGRADVYVDGHLVSTVDLYAVAPGAHRLVFMRSRLTAGVHTIRVVCQGTPGRAKVDVDSFIILH